MQQKIKFIIPPISKTIFAWQKTTKIFNFHIFCIFHFFSKKTIFKRFFLFFDKIPKSPKLTRLPPKSLLTAVESKWRPPDEPRFSEDTIDLTSIGIPADRRVTLVHCTSSSNPSMHKYEKISVSPSSSTLFQNVFENFSQQKCVKLVSPEKRILVAYGFN